MDKLHSILYLTRHLGWGGEVCLDLLHQLDSLRVSEEGRRRELLEDVLKQGAREIGNDKVEALCRRALDQQLYESLYPNMVSTVRRKMYIENKKTSNKNR